MFSPEQLNKMIKQARRQEEEDDIRSGKLVPRADNDDSAWPDDKADKKAALKKPAVVKNLPLAKPEPKSLRTWHDDNPSYGNATHWREEETIDNKPSHL